MPKRRIIRRRNKAVKRKTVSSSSLKSHDQQLNENDLPPHLLDKIPSSMSLRPTPQTLRSMLMQRLAPSYIQMPTMSPQQQQVQNLKNNNDIKEQAINQTKQDMINENERKRTLTRKEAEQKREQTKMKNEIENERQELKQQQDYERTMNELNIKKRQLEYEKMMNEHDAEALKKKNEIETGPATIYCSIDGDGMPKEYNINVVKKSDLIGIKSKGMIIEVTDEELLQKTGGIIQGMSGSPILQNGKFIGAVTHVYVNDPTRGYAIFAESMLEQLNEFDNKV